MRRRLGRSANSITRRWAERINRVRTYDFESGQTTDGRRLKDLTVEDEFTRECLSLKVGRRFTGRDVAGVLRELFTSQAEARVVLSDHRSRCGQRRPSAGRAARWNAVPPRFSRPRAGRLLRSDSLRSPSLRRLPARLEMRKCIQLLWLPW